MFHLTRVAESFLITLKLTYGNKMNEPLYYFNFSEIYANEKIRFLISIRYTYTHSRLFRR